MTIAEQTMNWLATANAPWADNTDPATTAWATRRPLSAVPAADQVVIASDADLPRLAAAVPGKTYVISGNLTGSVVVSAAGTWNLPVDIRGAYDGPDVTRFPTWAAGTGPNLKIIGSHVYCSNIAFVGNGNQPPEGNVYVAGGANRVSIERCWSYGARGANGYEIPAYSVESKDNVRYFRVRYCVHGHPTVQTAGGHWTMKNPNGANCPLYLYFYRNLLYNIDDAGCSLYGSVLYSIGRSAASDLTDNKAAFYENRIRDIVDVGEAIEMKCSGVVVANNTFEDSPNKLALRIRHGHHCVVQGNIFVDKSTTDSAGMIQIYGSDHAILNNWSVRLADGVPATASSPAGKSTIDLVAGNIDGLAYPETENDVPATPRQNAVRCTVGGNRMAVRVGINAPASPGQLLPAPLCVVGPAASVSKVPYRNRSVSIGDIGDRDYAGRGMSRAAYRISTSSSPGALAYGTQIGVGTTATNQPIPGADYDLVPVRLLDADVGVGCVAYP